MSAVRDLVDKRNVIIFAPNGLQQKSRHTKVYNLSAELRLLQMRLGWLFGMFFLTKHS